MGKFESEALDEIRSSHSDLLDSIEKERELSEQNANKLKSFFDNFVLKYSEK